MRLLEWDGARESEYAMPKVSLKQIAQEAGVSPSLVSQVFNNRQVRVSESTRTRILEIASKHNYKPNRLASGLKLKRTGTIAVIVPFTPTGFFSELIYHIEAYALDLGFNTLVLNTFGNREKEMQVLGLYQSQIADGILLAPQDVESRSSILLQMRDERYPFVFIDRYVDDIDAMTISSDHAQVARELTMRLVARGCKDIVFIKRDDELLNSTKRDRVQGYISAMESCSLAPQIVGFDYADGNPASLYERLKGRKTPEAIFLFSGFYMPYLLDVCRLLEYDNAKIQFATVDPFIIPFPLLQKSEIQGRFHDNLCVAIQNTSAIARQAVSALIARINGVNAEYGARTVPVEYVKL